MTLMLFCIFYPNVNYQWMELKNGFRNHERLGRVLCKYFKWEAKKKVNCKTKLLKVKDVFVKFTKKIGVENSHKIEMLKKLYKIPRIYSQVSIDGTWSMKFYLKLTLSQKFYSGICKISENTIV